MNVRTPIAVVLVAMFATACSPEHEERTELQYESVHIRVDRQVLFGDDAFAVIEPVWWTANIYDGPTEYEASLTSFTRYQRLLFAIEWYRAEVNNGGHDQFYFNSTGIVWRDAFAGFELLGLEGFASILRESARRLGGNPPLDRGPRQEILEKLQPDFGDLDARFYELEESVDLDAEMLKFARNHPEDFEFDGVVQQPVFPKN